MQIQLLDPQKHHRANFDCGNDKLNFFLKHIANQQADKDLARTYVFTENQSSEIVGFYTLTITPLNLQELPELLRKKIKYPVSAGLIARLAVDVKHQGKGYAKTLLVDALKNLYRASKLAAFPIVVVDAKEGVEAFYQQFGFIRIQQTPNRFYLPLSAIEPLML